MQAPGDEITFLKRRMVLQHDSRLTVQMHHKHVDQMCSLLGLNKKLQGKKSPIQQVKSALKWQSRFALA